MNLDAPLPAELGVGSGTALFVRGSCFDAERAIRRLHFVVGGEEQPVAVHRMPRLDYGYRIGFWGFVRIGPWPADSSFELGLRATFWAGETETVTLGSIRPAVPPQPLPASFPGPDDAPRVAICMATYDPPLELLRRQLGSIRAQTHSNWVCVISDDCSRAACFDAMCQLIGDDPRFLVSRSTRRLGFYGNFERAVALAPRDCGYVALADQDDAWYPEKLATLLGAIGEAQLVYSDARIIDRDGGVIADSYWERRRNNHTDLISLLVANSVTGAASLFRRQLLNYALPFPPGQFAHYHDHWVALVALAVGEIAYVDRPLYDYVQHDHVVLGHAAANRIVPLRARLARLRDDPRERIRVYRTRYFAEVMRLQAFATVLELRCGARMSHDRRHALGRFLALEGSWRALAWFGQQAVVELLRVPPETAGVEWSLLQALLWRRMVSVVAR